MNLLGAKVTEEARGEGQQAGTTNYFTGNDPSRWQSAVPSFGKVRLSGVYPGVDLVYYGRQGRLEYDFVVAPGADPAKIALRFDGAETRLAGNGDLILPVNGTGREIRFDKPTVYQMKDGNRQPVEGAFHLASDRTVSFELGSYDRRRELVIDPTLLFAGSIATGEPADDSGGDDNRFHRGYVHHGLYERPDVSGDDGSIPDELPSAYIERGRGRQMWAEQQHVGICDKNQPGRDVPGVFDLSARRGRV